MTENICTPWGGGNLKNLKKYQAKKLIFLFKGT